MWEKKDDEMQRSTISIVVLSLESFSEISESSHHARRSALEERDVPEKKECFFFLREHVFMKCNVNL